MELKSKVLSAALLAVMGISIYSLNNTKQVEAEATGTYSPAVLSIEKGRYYYMGVMDQDASDNGVGTDQNTSRNASRISNNTLFDTDADPILWLPVDVNADEAYMVSKNIMIGSAINTVRNGDYAISIPATWLPNVFYPNAFTDTEKALIRKQTLSGKGITPISSLSIIESKYEEASYNPDGTPIYIPSYTEIMAYDMITLASNHLGYSQFAYLKAGLSGESIKQSNDKNNQRYGKRDKTYITRSAGAYSGNSMGVTLSELLNSSGSVYSFSTPDPINECNNGLGILPSMRIDLKKIAFAANADDPMILKDANNTLTGEISDPSLKLTLLNDQMKISLGEPTSNGLDESEDTFNKEDKTYYFTTNGSKVLNVHYTNAQNAKAQENSLSELMVTVFVVDSETSEVKGIGRYPYSSAAEGEFKIELPSLTEGKYKLQIALEEVNYDVTNNRSWDKKEFNYSSALSNTINMEVVDLKFTSPTNIVEKNLTVGETLTLDVETNLASTFEWLKKNEDTGAWETVKLQNTSATKDTYTKTSMLSDSGTYKVIAKMMNFTCESPQFHVTVKKKTQTIRFSPAAGTLKIPLKKEDGSLNEINIKEVSKESDITAKDLLSLIVEGEGPGKITYTSSNPDIAQFKDGKLIVKKAGTITLSAVKTETADSDYESSSTVSKTIQIYTNLSAEYEALKTDLKQGSDDVKVNTLIGHIINQIGSPFESGKPYRYAIKTNVNNKEGLPYFSIDEDGNLSIINSPLIYGTYTLTITVTDTIDTLELPVKISVGLEEQGDFYITKDKKKVVSPIRVKMGSPAFLLGTANGKGGPVKFRLDDTSDSGIVSVTSGGNVTIIAPNESGKHAYIIAEIDENTVLGYAKQKTAKIEVIVEEAQLEDLVISKDGIAVTDGKITETYVKDKEFQLGVEGAPEGSTITYKLKDKLTADNETLEDVIAVTKDGLVTIKNASYSYQRNKVIVEATVKKSGYADKTVEVIVNIDKAEQSKFNFPTNNYEEVVEAGSGSFSVKFQNGGSSGKIKMMSEDSRITIDETKVTYVNIVNETILITAQQKGDRNYNDSEEKTMKLTALKEGETKFTVDISPSKVIYGGTAQFQPDEEPGVTYTYEADPSTIDIADIDTDNADKIITKKVGNAKFIITRYLNGVENGKANKTIKVWPKSITVKVKDYEKKVGEALPTYELEPITGLVGSDDLGTPVFSCDATATSPAKDSYVISAQFPDSEVLKNYELTSGGIKPGKLLVKQDEGDKAWYEILGTKGDEGWYTSDVTIKMKSGFDYDVFSQDQSSWNTEIGLTSEGKHDIELWFKNTNTEALSTSVKEEIKIDKTAPIVSQIKAVNSNSTIEDILNDISFGNFFKPGTKINIYTSDSGKTDVEVSKTKEVNYKIYPLDKDGNEGTPKTGIAQSTNEKASVTMNDVGRYKVCAIPKDHAGNPGEEQCAKVSIKDPEKDYDPNDLGCPSINLTMGTNKPILNIDRDGDGIPDMDIDIDGDGKPDINIDNDKDGKPDTNLVILKEWDPKICSTTEHSYGYVEDIKPLINIALDKEYKKPSINIDTTGDMKADINIDTNGDMKADLNIVTINIWKPEKDYIYKEFQYDTMTDLKRKVNIDTDGDGLPDVNIDYDGDGLPDLNIDINGDEIPDINIDITGDGEPDINIDYENDGTIDTNPGTITEWKPDLNTGEKDGFKYDTMSNIKVDDPIHELEHDPSGTVVETVDNTTSFNKKQTIIVADITNEMKLSGMPEVEKNIKENQEVKNVLDVKLYEDNVVTQPSGKVRVKIPLSEELKKMKNRVIMIEQKDGTYKEVSVKEENGYLVFETDYLGKVSIVADKEETTIHPDVDDGNKGNASVDNGNKTTNEDEVKSVKGASTIKGMGGAMTGDTTNVILYVLGMIIAIVLILIIHTRKKTES